MGIVIKSQSILEYLIILGAIIIGLVAAANAFMRPAVSTMVRDSGDYIERKSAEFQAR